MIDPPAALNNIFAAARGVCSRSPAERDGRGTGGLRSVGYAGGATAGQGVTWVDRRIHFIFHFIHGTPHRETNQTTMNT